MSTGFPPPGIEFPKDGIKGKKIPQEKIIQPKKLKEFQEFESEEISKTDWSEIKSIAESTVGSNGVFFALTENDKVIVIKSNQNIAEEMFASELAQILGICSPKIRLIQQGKSNEYDIIMEKIKTLGGSTKTFKRFFFFFLFLFSDLFL